MDAEQFPLESTSTEVTQLDPAHKDIFDKHIKAYNQSKTLKTLNLIYSLIVGILTSRLASKIPRGKIIGMVTAIISYLVSRKFLQINEENDSWF